MTAANSNIAATRDVDFIRVSAEMTTLIGPDARGAPVPPRAVALIVSLGDAPALHVELRPRLEILLNKAGGRQVIFLVQREAVARLGGGALTAGSDRAFHLSPPLRAIVLALRESPVGSEARSTYRLAKSIEFLCEAIRQFRCEELSPLCGDGQLSAADSRRVIAARQMIEERVKDKLTLDLIARACGLNRSKLTRGFKAAFDCTIAEAIAERRLELARSMLLTTDLPVSSIGYEAGYLNNASFSRAFGRRFGRSPSSFRLTALAA